MCETKTQMPGHLRRQLRSNAIVVASCFPARNADDCRPGETSFLGFREFDLPKVCIWPISTSDQVKFAAANRPFRSEAPGPRFAPLGAYKLDFARLPVKTSATMSRTISHQIKM